MITINWKGAMKKFLWEEIFCDKLFKFYSWLNFRPISGKFFRILEQKMQISGKFLLIL